MSFGYCHFDHFDTMMIHSLILTTLACIITGDRNPALKDP